ncbi:MAG: pilus assembly protein TadG-related protein, partial [Pseudomonadota bacterium]
MNFNRGVGQYVRNRRGATAVLFAFILVPLLLVVGLAVDLGMYQKQKMKVQHALDMASLAAARHLSKDLSADTADVQAIANAFFAAEIELENYVSMNDVSVERSGMRLNVGVDGTMPTSFMQLAGIDTMSLATNSEVVYGVPSKVEIALVLDTSTSMDQIDSGESLSRVESLKAAAKDMVSILFDPASSLNVEMAIVPFSNRVNIGTDQSGEAW